MMRRALGALAALLIPLAPVAAVAKGPAVMIEVVYQFTSPAGKARTWKEYITYSSAEAARTDCETTVPKPSKPRLSSYVTDYKELVGHTFVSAACTKKGDDYLISTKSLGLNKLPTPAAVGFTYKDKAGKVKTNMIYDARSSMSMTQCLKSIRSVTSQYKDKIPKTIDEFSGMTFVKSECVFAEDFEL